MKHVEDINGDFQYRVKEHVKGNELIGFVKIDALTEGLVPSYWDQWDSEAPWDEWDWMGYDEVGNIVEMKLSGIGWHGPTIRIAILGFSVDIKLEDYITATANIDVNSKEQSVIRGPVLTKRKEIVGMAFGQRELSAVAEKRRIEILIWPWTSVKGSLQEAKAVKQTDASWYQKSEKDSGAE